MNNPQGQVVSLAKPPQYWRRRAQQHTRRGEHRKAAALLRHAVALDPASGDLRMEYAKALRDMSCYEASIREAFGALAMEPAGFAPYQIIGHNMLSLGREQEAIDAFSHYLERAWASAELPLLLPEDDELFALEDLVEERPGRGRGRLDALYRIASGRLGRGDLAGAEETLNRAKRLGPVDERLHTLSAMLFEFLDRPEEALVHALISVKKNPRHVPSLCALASVRFHLGERGLAAAALMKAALACHYAHDEQLFCFTAAALDMPEMALAMLRLSRQRHPERLPTLHNYAVVLLHLGHLEQAAAYLHRCLDLDPEDLAVQALFHVVQGWELRRLGPEQVREKARDLAFYPFVPPEEVERILLALGDAFEQGVEAFSARVLAEDGFRRDFLYALFLPGAPLVRLIYPVATALSQQEQGAGERLLREILLQGGQGDLPKRHALSAMMAMDIAPPYVICQDGRILEVAPSQEAMMRPSALQRRLVRRVRSAARLAGDARMISHVLTLLFRMGRRSRYAFAADPARAWQDALLYHFDVFYGALPLVRPWENGGMSPGQKKRRDQAFSELCALMPLPDKEEFHGAD